jgi:hypothetical protein
MCVHNSYGQGTPIADLTPAMTSEFYKVLFITIVIYRVALGTVKTAILLQYYRIFATRMRTVTVWTIIVIGMWSVAVVFVSIFMCSPVRGFWMRGIGEKCIDMLTQCGWLTGFPLTCRFGNGG